MKRIDLIPVIERCGVNSVHLSNSILEEIHNNSDIAVDETVRQAVTIFISKFRSKYKRHNRMLSRSDLIPTLFLYLCKTCFVFMQNFMQNFILATSSTFLCFFTVIFSLKLRIIITLPSTICVYHIYILVKNI